LQQQVHRFLSAWTNKDTVSAARTIRWAPARRYTTFANGNTVRMYETASALPSAIDFIATGVELASIASAGAAADFAIATIADSVYFGTPRTLYSGIVGGSATLVDNTGFYQGVDSLNQIYESAANPANFIQRNYGVRNAQARGLLIYYRLASGNFAKMLIKSTGNSLLQGTAPNRFVEAEISFQPTANLGYTLALTAPKQSGSVQSSSVRVSPLIAEGEVYLESQPNYGSRNFVK
jgi:hypothetical protein